MKITAKIEKMLTDSTSADSEEWSRVTGLIISQQRQWRIAKRKEEEKAHDEAIKNMWRDGQLVKFTSQYKKQPGEQFGIIKKRNLKAAKVQVYFPKRAEWNVSYPFLKEVKNKEDKAKIAIGKMEG